MQWRWKARIQRGLSQLPKGDEINYLLQTKVTRSLPRSRAVLAQVEGTAARHREHLSRYVEVPLPDCTTLEFGAGWDLAAPLCLAAEGVGRQILIDVKRVARPNLVRGAIDHLADRRRLAPAPPTAQTVEALVEPYGIDYRAPADARSTGLDAHSIDAAVSTSVLEHVEPDDVRLIMDELRRILRPSGICTFVIDYHDHYASVDASIHGLNFLRYSGEEWRRWNSSMQFQNRMRHSDYIEIFRDVGFELADVKPISDPALPEEIDIASEFERYASEDLRVTEAWFVLRPAPA